ncbi:glycosyltransferase [Bacteriovorax sp. Seq25_V]|uniref:glycosyltransferase family 2 protein n=1 Tax=Bacteriovorax sp. Seq25_V TaxID=1201288 RepID=UPI000389DBA6|nr:glycosyltransferase [Bacteriovorax sp. Seq25_V]EQC43424.1 glycosyltransferase-like protein, family 2 [Bacteriovorax sp. Seq25_V]
MPKISVIIPTYNRSLFLARAIDSVLSQTYKDYELIIVDDGSTDNTEFVVQPYLEANEKIKFLKTDNNGVSHARNYGFKNSLGEWVAFLDSDDQWLPNKLEKQIQKANDLPESLIIYTDEKWIRNGKFVNKKKYHQKYGGNVFAECLKSCFIGPSTVLLKRELLEQYAGFDENFPVCEDYDLWLKVSLHHDVVLIPEELVEKYGGHDDQLSTTTLAMDFWRVKAICNLMDNYELDSEQSRKAIEVLKVKSDILLNGYRKHGNIKDYNELNDLIKSKIKGP